MSDIEVSKKKWCKIYTINGAQVLVRLKSDEDGSGIAVSQQFEGMEVTASMTGYESDEAAQEVFEKLTESDIKTFHEGVVNQIKEMAD